jgi:hypothetical protein
MRTNKIYAYFALGGFACEPSEITHTIGLTPTDTWKAGDLIGRSIRRRETNGWRLRSRLDEPLWLGRHVQDVIAQLAPKWPEVLPLCLQYEAMMNCVCYIYDTPPVFHFDREIIKRVAELNAWIDVDYYDFTRLEEAREGA